MAPARSARSGSPGAARPRPASPTTSSTACASRRRRRWRSRGGELAEADPDGKPGKRRIRPALWPTPDFVDVGIRGDLSEIAGARTLEPDELRRSDDDTKFIDAVAAGDGPPDGDGRAHRRDRRGRPPAQGRHQRRHQGLARRFPDRVLGTPISENAFAGLGGGMALDGRFRPVVEFMYPDFMWVAADQVFNQIGKARHMFGGDNPVPLVLRTKVAMGSGYGSQHSMDPAGIFATSARLAHRRPLDRRRLRRPDEHRARAEGSGARDRARRPLRLLRRRCRTATWTTSCRSARPRSAAPAPT